MAILPISVCHYDEILHCKGTTIFICVHKKYKKLHCMDMCLYINTLW